MDIRHGILYETHSTRRGLRSSIGGLTDLFLQNYDVTLTVIFVIS